MKERAPAFQFYPRQFSGDDAVMAMDLDALGAHILLMCAAAASPERYRIPCRTDAGAMPDECRNDAAERAIRTRLRNPAESDWQRIKSQLLSGAWKLSADGQWWEQDGLRRTFEKQREFSDKQRERALGRWGNSDPEPVPDGCRNDAEPVPEGMPEGCSSSSSSSSKQNTLSKPIGSDGKVLHLAIREVWDYYVTRLNKNPKLCKFTPDRQKKGLARLRECIEIAKDNSLENAVPLMKVAVDQLAASAFHNGDNDRGKVYTDWSDHLFPNRKKLEGWLEQSMRQAAHAGGQ